MGSVAFLTLQKVAVLVVLISAGVILRKSKKLPENTGKILSAVCTLLFCPAYNIRNLSQNVTMDSIGSKLGLFGLGAVMIVLIIAVAMVLARVFTKDDFQRRCLTYAFAISNYGYFGYPVVEGVFGSAALGNMIVFAIPTTIATYTWGYLLFNKDGKLSLKKILTTPMVIAVATGITLGLSGIRIPGFLNDALNAAANCMSPVSMVVAGFILGGMPLKKLFKGGKAYFYNIIRLLGLPLLFGIPLYFLGLRENMLMMPLLMLALPLGLNLVVYPESFGYDATDNAQMCFISYIMALAILPVTFEIINFLAFS